LLSVFRCRLVFVNTIFSAVMLTLSVILYNYDICIKLKA